MTTANHWHVATGLAGYGPEASDGNWATINESDATGLADTVRSELQEIAEMERDTAEILADSGEYKDAWETMRKSWSLYDLAANFDNKRSQAPLYAGNPALWHETIYRMVAESFPVDYRDGNSRLYVWECSETDCHDDGSELYHTGRHEMDAELEEESAIRARLEELRLALRAESISYGELHELQSLAAYIDAGDVELLEPAGVPEFED